MAFFLRPAWHSAPEASFNPLFRLLDEFESQSREAQCNNTRRHHRRHARTFNPKFDVRETETAYELHGELPGVERDNLHIEFSEPQTIVIRGRVERSYTAGTPQVAAAQDAEEETNGANDWESVTAEKEATPSHQATVSDEETESEKEQGSVAKPAEPTEKPTEEKTDEPKQPADKYWVSERSIGEFTRSFSFSGRVEQEGVTANLNNGILTVVVPKSKKHEPRYINVA